MRIFCLTVFYALVAASALHAQALPDAPKPTKITRQAQQVSGGPLLDQTQTYYYYNANNHLIGTLQNQWNADSNAFVRSRRTIVSPNAAGQTDQINTFNWNGSDWANAEEEKILYDAAGHVLLHTKAIYSGTNTWTINYRLTQTYTADGQLLTYVWEINMGGALSKLYEAENTYNGALQRTKLEYRQYNGAEVAFARRTYYEYDGFGRLQHEKSESKTSDAPDWKWNYWNESIYNDPDNQVDLVKRNSWNTVTNAWYWPQVEDVSYTYTPEETIAIGNPSGIVPLFKTTTHFNALGQKTDYTLENWSNILQALKINYQEIWTYTAEGALNDYRIYQATGNAALLPISAELYEYQSFVTTSAPVFSGTATIYPNPANQFIQVQVDQDNNVQPVFCTLIDPSGKIIGQTSLTGGYARFSVEDQPAGTYYVRMEQGAAVKVVPVLKY